MLERANTLVSTIEEDYRLLNEKLQNTLEKFESLETEHEMTIQSMIEQNKLIIEQKTIIENLLQVLHHEIDTKIKDSEELRKFDGYIEMFFPNFK